MAKLNATWFLLSISLSTTLSEEVNSSSALAAGSGIWKEQKNRIKAIKAVLLQPLELEPFLPTLLLDSTLLVAILLDSTLLVAMPVLVVILLDATLFDAILLVTILLEAILLDAILLVTILLDSTMADAILLDATLVEFPLSAGRQRPNQV